MTWDDRDTGGSRSMIDSPEKYLEQYPLSLPAYNVARIAAAAIQARAAAHLSGSVIDIGCGTMAKEALVGPFVERYVGLDHPGSLHDLSRVDLLGTAYNIPVRDDTFDCALCTAVLEHLEEPQQALRETYRILKPGGVALYTAPLFWHLHEEPRDFYRYTKYGLQHLFVTAGFEVHEITPLAGFWTTFGTEWNYYLRRFRDGPQRILIDWMIALGNLLFPCLDRGRARAEQFTWMYIVVARKPGIEA